MNEWTGEGSYDGIATFRQQALCVGDTEFFVRDMPRQEFRNHELLARCSCDSA